MGRQKVVVVLPAVNTVDRRLLKNVVQESFASVVDLECESNRSRMWPDLVAPHEAARIAGAIPGTIPPIGHTTNLPIVCDDGIRSRKYVLGGGGDTGFDLLICAQTIFDCSQAVASALSLSPGQNCRSIRERQHKEQSCKRKKWKPPAAVIDGASIRRASRKCESDDGLEQLSHTSVQTVPSVAPELREQLEIVRKRSTDIAHFLNSERSSTGKLALHLAAWRGTIKSCMLLLDAGASADAISTGEGNYGKVRTALILFN